MRTILITGANRGIGLEMVKQYLAQEWRVFACCRDPKSAEQLNLIKTSKSNQLIVMRLDVGNENEIHQLGKQLEQEPIDILMNNAGIIGSRSVKFGELEMAPWLETFKINTIAPSLLTQVLSKSIARSELKIVVNISSTLGSISFNKDSGFYYYRASKSALNAVTKNLSVDLKEKGVTVVSLHPGWVKTDMGGQNAEITTEKSVEGIRKALSALSIKDTGSFISYAGKEIDW